MMLDTNALSAWAEGVPTVEGPLGGADRVIVPAIVLGEYYFGIRQSQHPARYETWLRQNLPLVEMATVSSATASEYADIRLQLKSAGTPIPANDVWIAALARQHGQQLLSNDAHFDHIAGLARIAF